jgi:hypothetical protein
VTAAGPGDQGLPEAVSTLLDGSALASKVSTTVLLATAGPDGWPRLAMLSPGEVLVTDPRSVRLALHATSRTCQALRETGRGLLSVVVDGAAYRVRVRARAVPVPAVAGSDELFVADVEEVVEDRVPYARLTHGIGYELEDVPGTLLRWEAKLARLSSLDTPAS